MHLTLNRAEAARFADRVNHESRLDRASPLNRRHAIRIAAREWAAMPHPIVDLERPPHRFHPLIAALLIMLGAGLFWFGVFYAGTTVGMWLREVLP